MKYCFFLIYCSAILINTNIGAQDNKLKDSLYTNWNNASLPDSVRLMSIDLLIWKKYIHAWPDSAIQLAGKQQQLAQRSGLRRFEALAFNSIGTSYKNMSEFGNAMAYYRKALDIFESIKDNKGIANSYGSIGNLYHLQGIMDKAIEYHSKSLSIHEKTGNKQGISFALLNIGNIYASMGENDRTLDFYLRSWKIKEELGDTKGIANSLNNIGNIYLLKKQEEKALEYYRRCLKIRQEIGDLQGTSISYLNIGNILFNTGKYDEALRQYKQSTDLSGSINDLPTLSSGLNGMGNCHFRKGNTTEAIKLSSKALSIVLPIKAVYEIRDASKSLYEFYKHAGDHDRSYEMYQCYVSNNDSIQSEENHHSLIRQELKYQFEKKTVEDSVNHVIETEIANALIKKQQTEIRTKKNQQIFISAGIAIILVFILFLYNRYKIIRHQSQVIEEQKYEAEMQKRKVSDKQKEILDSIQYAQRIQKAHLPASSLIIKKLRISGK